MEFITPTKLIESLRAHVRGDCESCHYPFSKHCSDEMDLDAARILEGLLAQKGQKRST